MTGLSSAPFRLRRRHLRRHLDVLEAAFARTTVVPCAFGTILPGVEAVREELLEERADDLLALLRRLEGRVQQNLKVAYDEEAVLRELVAADGEIARLNARTRDAPHAQAERLRLGELVASALLHRRERDAGAVVDALAPHAEDVRVEPVAPPLVLKGSFLVARDRLDRFDAALEELASKGSDVLRFEAFGPLPPTAFASLDARE